MILNKHLGKIKEILVHISLICGFLLVISLNANAQNSNNTRADENDLYLIAKVQGYNDGLRRGTKDARKKRKNPQKTSEYKNGTNGFEAYYGKRKDYKRTYAGNKKLHKQVYNERKKAYQKVYRDGFMEGFAKAGNANPVKARSNVAVRKKRSVFGRIRRFILRN